MKKGFFIFILILLALGMASVTLAYNPLEDGLIPGGPKGCQTGCPCTICDFYTVGQNIITFLLGISASIVALMFLWGGIEIMTSAGNTSRLDAGKKKLTSAVIGLALAFFGWVIINTLMNTIVNSLGFPGKKWYERPNCGTIIEEGRNCKTTFPEVASAVGEGTPKATAEKEAYVRDLLTKASIKINSNTCPPTCVGELPNAAIQGLLKAARDCPVINCIEVTAGSESAGHVSHGPGIPNVDIRYTPSAYNHLTSATGAGVSEDGHFGKGITCEPTPIPGQKSVNIPCDGSKGKPSIMHVEF